LGGISKHLTDLQLFQKTLRQTRFFFLRFPIWNVQNGTVGGSILSRAAFLKKADISFLGLCKPESCLDLG
jgi:hypothetical protein